MQTVFASASAEILSDAAKADLKISVWFFDGTKQNGECG